METFVARLLREYPAPDKEANPFAWVGNEYADCNGGGMRDK